MESLRLQMILELPRFYVAKLAHSKIGEFSPLRRPGVSVADCDPGISIRSDWNYPILIAKIHNSLNTHGPCHWGFYVGDRPIAWPLQRVGQCIFVFEVT